MADENPVIEVVPPHLESDNLVDIPRGEPETTPAAAPTIAPAQPVEKAKAPETSKPLQEPPEVANPDVELLNALRKERDRERAERAAEKQQLTTEAARRIDAERRRAAEAEKELQTRTGQAIRAHWQAVNSDLQQITSAIGSTKQEIEHAKHALAAASEAGNHIEIANAQERIALAAADLRALEHGQSGAKDRVEEAKRAIEAMAAQAEQERRPQPQPQQRQQPQPQQPKQPQTPEDWIAACPQATQDWLRQHKDYVTDPKLNRKLLRFADEWADDNGVEALNTSAFVKALNGRFAPKQENGHVPGENGDNSEAGEDGIIEIDPNKPVAAVAAPRRQVVAAAAPVSRATPTTPSAPASMRVRLSQEQMAIAPLIYPDAKTPQEARARYAAHLLQANAEGKFASRE